MKIKRVMRMNYDKHHRCPAWSGPAWVFRDNKDCEGGSITIDYDRWWWGIRPYFHKPCGTLVLPYHSRWFEWRTYRWLAWRMISDWKYERLNRRLERRWDEEQDW